MEDYKNISDYINSKPASQRVELERLRAFIKQTVPEAEQTISYAMPTFTYKGRPLMHFAAFKDHLSIFPTANPIAEMQDRLKEFATGKGTLQYQPGKPIPNDIIKDLLLIRVATIDNK